ncbi:MAG: adenylate/guanylate cyclase domain-containing protein [Bradyrhizobium sp.]|nr:adenylate/guanylate cyclase domain-containing protein [Bradyrhizobium sp.]
MNTPDLSGIQKWLTQASLAGNSEAALLEGFCERSIGVGLPLARALMIIDTLHPVYEGRAFNWRRDTGQTAIVEYGPSTEGEVGERWRRSVLFHLLETGGSLFRVRFHAGETSEFVTLAEMRDEGMTDVAAMVTRFAAPEAIGEMDCLYAYWATDKRDGFKDADVEAIAELMPMLAVAMKCVSLARIAETLVETYLGRDPGRRVLNGLIRRGVADRINAVLWYSDLRSFTRLSEQVAPDQIIPLLDDYAEVTISAIYENGGDVLKLIGDGILAIFVMAPDEEYCGRALKSYALVHEKLRQLNQRRARNGLPTTEIYVGLHLGDVFYGNIGSRERLDFTVVGPAVNEAARIAALCRSVERDVLISQEFVQAVPERDRGRLVSVGRYALRGVKRPQELFTVDPLWNEPGSVIQHLSE